MGGFKPRNCLNCTHWVSVAKKGNPFCMDYSGRRFMASCRKRSEVTMLRGL
jgi:hypothetical protein